MSSSCLLSVFLGYLLCAVPIYDVMSMIPAALPLKDSHMPLPNIGRIERPGTATAADLQAWGNVATGATAFSARASRHKAVIQAKAYAMPCRLVGGRW